MFLWLLISFSPVLSAAELALAPPAPPEQIPSLIVALGDADYFVRQKAEADLGKIGFDAVEALTAASEHDDMEIATRANRLLCAIRSNWAVSGEPPGVSRLLADYESQDDNSRHERIIQLVNLPQDQGAAAVCRIIRFERSLSMAKIAAVQLLKAKASDAGRPELAAMLQKGLGACRRAPAQWVLAWWQARQDSRAQAKIWTQFVAEEEGLLLRQPRDTSLYIIESLLQLQITALRKIGRSSDAALSVERLIQFRRGEPAELARLLNWLIDQKDWPATRLVEKRCKASIAESADLLYLVAEAQVRRGDAAAAAQSADQALKLNADSDESSLEMHFQAGENLEQRGRFEWATKEWEYVIHNAPPRCPFSIVAARRLAELCHDLEEDQRAAETLGCIERVFSKRSNQWLLPSSEGGEPIALGTLRARMHYFDACHWKARGDRAKQRQCLESALATQFSDIEVLIECYQIPDFPADYRTRIRDLIEKRRRELREQIADLGTNIAAVQPCNEFAWLVANTEGDLDEALRFSKRSLELIGEQGAFCDTLARVYFAKGDYANALKYQIRAGELMPHSHAVQKQLDLFRKKAAEKGKEGEKKGKKGMKSVNGEKGGASG